ncbi:MAG: hypothetical protein RL660_3007 [Bacteroidota bacterium]|jgi:pimeloyl-ACP methyl ester carboxylesterase
MTPKKPRFKWLKRLLALCFVLFLALNCIAYLHAYKFTHFTEGGVRNVKSEDNLSTSQKLHLAVTGVSLPQPENTVVPPYAYTTIRLPNDIANECWLSNIKNAKGTVVLCHGYAGSKAGMLAKAIEFHVMGYNTLLIDFSGTKSSGTRTCTIGYNESKEVRAAVAYLRARGEKNIICCGTSMGAVAIIKAEHDSSLKCSKFILECPFGSLKQTVYNRFVKQGAPTFPMADLMLFWGGAQNGFNAFEFNPTAYAKSIKTSTLLMCGTNDEKVTADEINGIYANLAGSKELLWLQGAGHAFYLNTHCTEWCASVSAFLNKK